MANARRVFAVLIGEDGYICGGGYISAAVVGGVCGAGSGFRVEYCNAGKLYFVFFSSFLLVCGGLGTRF